MNHFDCFAKTVTCLFFEISVLLLQAQTPNFKNYTIDNGLAQSQIYTVIQDSKGFLWAGTDGGGASKFDGKNFKNYTIKDGLPDNIIYCIYEARNGNILFGTNSGGLAIFDGFSFKVINTQNGLSHNKVYSIFQDSKGNIWIGTEKGLNKYDGKRIYSYYAEDGLIHDRIRSILEDDKGAIWLGTDAGLSVYDGISFQNIPNTNYETAIIWSMHKMQNGHIAITWYNGGFSTFDGNKFTNYNTSNGLKTNVNYFVYQDSKSETWIGTDALGISKIEFNDADQTIKAVQYFSDKDGLINNRVRAALEDKEHNLWFATDGGLVKYDRAKITGFYKSNGIINNKIHSISKDENKKTFFGTDGGLSIFENGSYKNFTVENGLPHNRIWCIYNEPKQDITWIGTYQGLSKFDGNKFINYTHEDGLPSDIIYALSKDKDGNLWIGSDAGISIIKKAEQEKERPFFETIFNLPGITNLRIRCIYRDSENNLWFGTLGAGILKYDGNKFVNFTQKDGIANNIVFSITEDNDKNIWAGTYGGGISRISNLGKTKKIKSLNSSNGLANDAVLSITKDNDGMLWIGTIKGIDKFDASAYNYGQQPFFKHFEKQEGFNGIECLQNANYKDEEGKIWVGTINGAFCIDPDKDERTNYLPKTYINNLLLFLSIPDWKEIDDTLKFTKDGLPKNLVLPYSKNHLTFKFIGINLTSPESVKYKYMLEGSDESWSPETKETSATYSNIPPGKYTFKVIASNSEGRWITQPTVFEFEIKPPFWKTWWFYSLLIIAALLSVMVIIWQIVRKINLKRTLKEKQLKDEINQQKIITGIIIETQEQERKRIAEELHDGLGQIFSAIKLNLTAIEDQKEFFKEEKKKNYDVSKSLLDQGINELRAISHNMMPYKLKDLGLLEALQALCNQYEQTHLIKFSFIAHGLSERLNQSIEITLYRITQELTNNIIKHSKATQANIQLIKFEKSILLQVEDNGIGFNFTNQEKTRKGIGLENIKSRTQLLYGTFTIDSNSESGTTISIEIPLQYNL